jgi:hypothetical protein
VCIAPTTQTISGLTVTVCDALCADGSPGCDFHLTHRNPQLAGATFTSAIDQAIDIPITVAGFGCSLRVTANAGAYSDQVTFADDGLRLTTQAGTGTLVTTYTVSGCGPVQPIAAAVFQLYQSRLTDAVRGACDATLASYRGDCPF